MKQLIVTGNTYPLRESLKKDGFRWNPSSKAWTKNFDDTDKFLLKWAEAYGENGVKTQVKTLSNPDEKKYWVKESWVFNLESMHDKLGVLEIDLDEKRLQFPLRVAGKDLNSYDDLEALRQEVYQLEHEAKHGKVTGRQYGRIQEVVAWRVEQRYATCLAAGMEEAQAGQCFEDM